MWPLHASYSLTASAFHRFCCTFMAFVFWPLVSLILEDPFTFKASKKPSSPHCQAEMGQRVLHGCRRPVTVGAACSLIPIRRRKTPRSGHVSLRPKSQHVPTLVVIQRSLEFCQHHVIPNNTYRFLRWARTKLCESIQLLSTV